MVATGNREEGGRAGGPEPGAISEAAKPAPLWTEGLLRYTVPAAAAAVLLGLALRVAHLRDYWLNPDEGLDYAITHLPTWSAFWAEVATNAHPPLFNLLLCPIGAITPDPFALRWPSVVLGAATAIAAYLGVRRLSGPFAGVLAAFLAAAAPGLVIQSQVIRPYATQVCLLAFSAWLLARFTDGRRRADLLGSGALLLAASLTHYGSVALVGAVGAALAGAVLVRRLPLRDVPWLAAAVVPAVVALLAGFVLHVRPIVAPLWLGPAFEAAYDHLLYHDVAGVWSGVVGAAHYIFGPRLGAEATLLSAIGLGCFLWRRQLGVSALVLGALGIAAVMSLAGRYPFGASRHSLYLAVVLVPCVAEGLRWLLERPPQQAALSAAALVLLALYPGPLRAALGTRPLRIIPEKVTPTAAVRAETPLVEEVRQSGLVLLMDKQTYFVLMPFLDVPYAAAVRDSPETLGKPRLARIPIGRGELLVASTWAFGLDPGTWNDPTQLLGALVMAEADYPDVALARRHDAVLLFAGWSAPHYASLSGLTCAADVRARRGLGSARLDPARCLAGAAGRLR